MKKPRREVQRLARLKLNHEGFRPPLAHADAHGRFNAVLGGSDVVAATQRTLGFETTPSGMWTYWECREPHAYLRVTHSP